MTDLQTDSGAVGSAGISRWQKAVRAGGLVAVLALSACGDDTDEGSGVASAGGEADSAAAEDAEGTETLDEDDQALVFAECMRDNGIDFPDPGAGQEGLASAFQELAGTDQTTLEQAFTACEDLLPQFEQGGLHEEAEVLDLAECLREQGLDVSDEPFDDMHSGEIDQDDLAAAMEVCRDVLIGGDS